MKPEWVEGVKRQSDDANVAVFFKLWGTWASDGQKRPKHANGRRYRAKYGTTCRRHYSEQCRSLLRDRLPQNEFMFFIQAAFFSASASGDRREFIAARAAS